MTQSSPCVETPRVLGFDVAKAEIVVHDLTTRRTFKICNSQAALRAALATFSGYELAVCETTGGYENALLSVCLEIGLPIHRAHAKRIKSFIDSHGGRATTDAIDAAWIARYGAERFATLTPLAMPDRAKDDLAALMRLRQGILAMRTQAKYRRAAPGAERIARHLDAQIDFLTAQIKQLDADLAAIIKANAEIQRDEAALRSTPGIGPVSARTLIAFLPELGALSKRQVASLAGLAPHPRDSGQTSARRTIGGGRSGIKEPLFMAALRAVQDCPTLKAFYERPVSAGKPKRLDLTAVARKRVVRANAILKALRAKSDEERSLT